MSESEIELPDDPFMAFATLVSKCCNGLMRELVADGKTETQARNAVIRTFLDFAAGEGCRVARREGREPDANKWAAATTDAFERAVKRTAAPFFEGEGAKSGHTATLVHSADTVRS